jgi:hypothetical protein
MAVAENAEGGGGDADGGKKRKRKATGGKGKGSKKVRTSCRHERGAHHVQWCPACCSSCSSRHSEDQSAGLILCWSTASIALIASPARCM